MSSVLHSDGGPEPTDKSWYVLYNPSVCSETCMFIYPFHSHSFVFHSLCSFLVTAWLSVSFWFHLLSGLSFFCQEFRCVSLFACLVVFLSVFVCLFLSSCRLSFRCCCLPVSFCFVVYYCVPSSCTVCARSLINVSLYDCVLFCPSSSLPFFNHVLFSVLCACMISSFVCVVLYWRVSHGFAYWVCAYEK